MPPRYNRILLTGAAGALGSILRRELPSWCRHLRVSDRVPLESTSGSEEVVICDLADAQAVRRLTDDVDVIVHMGGAVGDNLPFDDILAGNIVGLKNIYENARINGVQRIIWGSSNHALGFYPRTQRLDAAVLPRPDSYYGVSKVFGEAMAQYYWDKFQLESVSLRIGSCFPQPTDVRMLSTWLSYPDFVRLIERCLLAPRVEHTVAYGVSRNDTALWDNHMAGHLGYLPQDNGEDYRAEIEAGGPLPDRHGLAISVHGGGYAASSHAADEQHMATSATR